MLEALLKKLTRQLDDLLVPYMIIGGQAVLLYGRPRLTRDIDITLGIDVDEIVKIESLCRSLNLKILVENPQAFTDQTRVLPTEDPESRLRIDFIFSFTSYERQAIKNANPVQISDFSVNFASCEDVIIHKMIAGRAIDKEDVKSILAKNKASLDTAYIEKWLKEFALLPEYERAYLRWTNLLRESGES
jgi:predicted nucleotidyltransferase